MRIAKLFLRYTLAALLLAPVASRAQAGGERAIALVGVTVIDPASAKASQPVVPNQTIVIARGVIQAIGATASVAIPRGARRIDAAGKFVIPGLWDAHVHFMNATAHALPVYLALGVTSVREMGGFLDSTRVWQSRMKAGTLAGPRILTPGPILESPSYLRSVRQRSELDPRLATRILPYRIGVGDSIDARKAMDSLVKLRVDFVKIRTTETPESYFAILREARRVGLQVAGHQPSVVSVITAVDSGQRDIEHAIGPPLSRLSAEARDSVYLEFARRGTWYTPTLVVSNVVTLTPDSAMRAAFGADALRNDERRTTAAPWLIEWWRMQLEERLRDTSSERIAGAREMYASSLGDVRRMHELGVRMLAGTDAGSVLVYPGFSLHEELRLLVEGAGFSPLDALWSATVGPARFAGMDARLGRIANGQIADLVLLDANPLENIRNSRRIFGVVQAGRLYSKRELDTMLARVRRDVKL